MNTTTHTTEHIAILAMRTGLKVVLNEGFQGSIEVTRQCECHVGEAPYACAASILTHAINFGGEPTAEMFTEAFAHNREVNA